MLKLGLVARGLVVRRTTTCSLVSFVNHQSSSGLSAAHHHQTTTVVAGEAQEASSATITPEQLHIIEEANTNTASHYFLYLNQDVTNTDSTTIISAEFCEM